MNELNELDQEELARLIKEGYTSGRIDDENGRKISWELKTKIWTD